MEPQKKSYRLIQYQEIPGGPQRRQSRSVFFLCLMFSVTFLSFLFSLHYFKVSGSTTPAAVTASKLDLEFEGSHDSMSSKPSVQFDVMSQKSSTKSKIELKQPVSFESTLDPDTESKLLSWELCVCKSKKSGKFHNLCYTDPQNSNSIGKQFDCAHLEILEDLHLLDNPGPFANLSLFPQTSGKTVFVSAASDNHFHQAIEAIDAFYKHNPDGKLIFYSLDLPPNDKKSLQKKFPRLEIRAFNTTGYPKYINNWGEYRFKPLIIAEVLREFEYVWWMDANIRVEKGNLTGVFAEEIEGLVKNEGVAKVSPIHSFVYTGHGNFPVMIPELLKYFPTNSMSLLKDEKRAVQLGANTFFIARTEWAVEFLKWWVLCALDETCMNPPGAKTHCEFKGNDRYTKFANCFRYDQSVLNLLLLNQYQDHNKYMSKHGEFFSRTS